MFFKELIAACLNAAAEAKDKANEAYTYADTVNTNLTSLKDTYNGHTHKFSASGTTTATISMVEAKQGVKSYTATASGNVVTFKVMGEKDNHYVGSSPAGQWSATPKSSWDAKNNDGAVSAKVETDIEYQGFTKEKVPWSIKDKETDEPSDKEESF